MRVVYLVRDDERLVLIVRVARRSESTYRPVTSSKAAVEERR
jgi:hypothetical protein